MESFLTTCIHPDIYRTMHGVSDEWVSPLPWVASVLLPSQTLLYHYQHVQDPPQEQRKLLIQSQM